MALANYTDLQAAISDYLDDSTLDARIPDFIRLFEVKAQRVLRTSQSKNIAEAQTDANGQVNVPLDFRGIVRITLDDGTPLNFLPPDEADFRNSYASNRRTSNWLLAQHPDAYLYGSLAEAEAFGFNDARLATWRALASDSLAQVIGSDLGTEWADAASVMPDRYR
jgi:hypothetical protein